MLEADQMTGKPSLYIVIGIVFYTVCNILFDVFGISGIWYIGNAFAFVCYAYALHLKLNNRITKLLLVLTIGQLSDELIGNPLNINLFEYLIPIFYYGYLGYKNTLKE